MRIAPTQLHPLKHPKRKRDGIVDDEGKIIKTVKKTTKERRSKQHNLPVASNSQTRVLGKKTLQQICDDMEQLQLPSWVSKAPSHPGESKWGKFSADQWRAFCTINLPITLIRLWGSRPKDSREHRMLVNFMHLVTAVKLATMRKTSPSRIAQYEDHMHQYLEGVLVLFPGTGITPYQHMALHFGEQLRRFGPTHSWRCFPFERYNYLLQKIPTNNKFGQH